jgi:hypothetical protein
MCCLVPGAAGSGLPTVSDASVLTALTSEEKQVLQERVVWFPPPPSTGWAGHHGRVLEPPVMRISAAMANGADCSAIDKLYAAILQRETPLQISSGTVWVVDNFRCCHGRAEIHEGLSSTRHLLRLYAEPGTPR